jgi:predicted AAA+ superfamily ATPase
MTRGSGDAPDAVLLARIAAALERLAPPAVAEADPAAAAAMRWDGRHLVAVAPAATVPLERFVGVDAQRAALARNLRSLAQGGPAHDMLLWGARGMGKSALVRALAADAGLALVETPATALATLPALFARLAAAPGPFVVFVDDIAFDALDDRARALRSLLDGGVAARPAQVRLAVTSNHRHLHRREAETTARHARDAEDDATALTDRFGLVLGFHAASQDQYLAMCRGYLAAEGLVLDEADALAFALARGGRSGRTAWHYLVEVRTRTGACK